MRIPSKMLRKWQFHRQVCLIVIHLSHNETKKGRLEKAPLIKPYRFPEDQKML